MTGDVVDFELLERGVEERAGTFANARPFPHIVVDGVLPDAIFGAACEEFGQLEQIPWKNYYHLNERKQAHTRPQEWGPTLASICASLQSDRFVRFLERLSGLPSLLADPDLDGGGLHRMYRGGHLNVHADFTAHHVRATWQRRINVLLYLNPEWSTDWGGELELWAPDMSRCVTKVAPLGNRLLVFRTDMESFHGHPEPLRVPDGRARQSMALYYFSEESAPVIKSTNYRPRPGDGLRSAGIRIDSLALRSYDALKRRFGWRDEVVSRVSGRFRRRQK